MLHETVLSATRPWYTPNAFYHAKDPSESVYDKNSILYGRIIDEKKLEGMKTVYQMLKNNYSVTNREIADSLKDENKKKSKQVREVMVTLSDHLPIWMEQDNEDGKMSWFGMLNREKKYVPELED